MYLVTRKLSRKDQKEATEEDLKFITGLPEHPPFMERVNGLIHNREIFFRETNIEDGQIVTETVFKNKDAYHELLEDKTHIDLYDQVSKHYDLAEVEEEEL